jgi:TRAP transporter TAXI family solute receptor
MSFVLRGLISAFVIILLQVPTFAAESHEDRVTRTNQGTVGIISGGIGGTYIRIATDLAAVLDDDEGELLRILPVAGKGSVQNIHDILYLRGIDVGIVQSDVLTYIQRERLHSNIDQRIHYIAKLYNEEFHLIARDDIRTVEELAGRNVNFGNRGSGTYMTASIVFDSLNVAVLPTTYDQALALEKLRAGQIDAMVYVAGKPANAFADVSPSDGLRLVPIPYTEALQSSYLPSSFSSEDYAGLVPPGENVETVAVGAVMAVFNWRPGTFRYGKVERFIETFFTRFNEFLQSPRHAKWHEVNLAAELPGWTRFQAAADWLEAHPQVAQVDVNLEESFREFLNQQTGGLVQLDQTQQDALFQQFLQWQQGSSVQ